jgi:response regulator RpfG family c-di-GMP phosphodiesterase
MTREQPPVLLIVDDEERILSALRRVLRKEGYEILTAGGAAEALETLQARDVQGLLSDHKMPGVGGLELLERVAAFRPHCALLLITGWPEEVDPDRVRELGIRAVIPKPWDDGDLKAMLRKALASGHAPGQHADQNA